MADGQVRAIQPKAVEEVPRTWQRSPASPVSPPTESGTRDRSASPELRAIPAHGGQRKQPAEWHLPPDGADIDDSLASCLCLLAGLLGRPISLEALKAGLPQDGNGFSPGLCIRAAERADLSARMLRRPELRSILPVTLPCILLLEDGGACVLLRFLPDACIEVALPDAGGGTRSIEISELEKHYTGYAIFVRPRLAFDSRAPDESHSQTRSWFWGTLTKFWPIYSHVLLASVLINSFAVALPLFIMNVYDRVVPNNALETLWVLSLGIGTVLVFEFLMRNLRSYFVDVAGKNADVIIANDLIAQVMAMRLDRKPPSIGALANNLREFESLRDFFTSGTLVALVDLPFIFLFIGVIWLIAGPVAMIPLATVPLVIGAGLLLQSPLRHAVQQNYRQSAQKHALLVEAIGGLETIKASRAEGQVQRRWQRFVGATAETSRKARLISTLSTTFAQVSAQFATIGVIVYGVYRIADGDLTIGGLIACTILTSRALAPLGVVAAMITRFQQSRVALRALDTLMNTQTERPKDKNFLARPRLAGQIEFKNVVFAYPGQEDHALEGTSFRIKAGEKVGIIGRIGSGKTTIGRLCLGLYEPASGAVLIDGTDTRQLDPADIRRNVGCVSQDTYLFFGSVRENICFGEPQADDQAVLRAATIAGVTDFLRTHPLGFDLQVGERGQDMSGGQRQAVTIARALLCDPPIIVLDEPTSHMDNSTEALFKQRLSRTLASKTLVLITHRSSLLTLVDRLLVVDSGRIVADGPRDTVLAALKQGHVRAAAE